jgi:hypothetical protein
MRYHPHPPYEILQNKLIDFPTMQRLRRFAKYWDLVGNSGNFVETAPLLWTKVGQASSLSRTLQSSEPREGLPKLNAAVTDGTGRMPVLLSAFAGFMRFSDWLYARIRRTDSIALSRLAELLFKFLTDELHFDQKRVAESLYRDYQRGGRAGEPEFLRPWIQKRRSRPLSRRAAALKRQGRHSALLVSE